MTGRSVVITGAASPVGAACARRFAEAGDRLVLADADEAAGKAVEEALADTGACVAFVHADTSRRLDVHNVIAEALDGLAPTHRAGDMQDAVRQAADISESGDTVLLAPACASFDMFDNYMHRGDVFCEAVEALAGWVRDGRLAYREHILEGADAAPGAIEMLYQSRNEGKLLVRVD